MATTFMERAWSSASARPTFQSANGNSRSANSFASAGSRKPAPLPSVTRMPVARCETVHTGRQRRGSCQIPNGPPRRPFTCSDPVGVLISNLPGCQVSGERSPAHSEGEHPRGVVVKRARHRYNQDSAGVQMAVHDPQQKDEPSRIRAQLAAIAIERLRLEARLREIESEQKPSPPPLLVATVTNGSPAADKIALFRRLFAGRTDVFPHDGRIQNPAAA